MPFPFQPGQVEAFLRPKNKPPIAAQQVTTDKTPAGFALLIAFPRTDPITLDDREVEFTFKAERFGVGIAFSRPFEFTRTFKLRDMQVGDILEL